ncbi:MAG: ATP-binding protein [Alphaproteobacteria bacterium]|nr:ATP-binding protein [Alphaproteobacteria bacterium]
MTRWLLRLWPEGIAGRLGLLLLAALAVFCLAAALVYLDEWRDRAVDNFGRAMSVRMTAMVEFLEETPADGRQRLQTVLSDRRFRVRLLPGQPQGQEWLPPERVDMDAARHLQVLQPRPVLMRLGGAGPKDRHGRPRIAVAVALEDGAWTEFIIRRPYWPRSGPLIWLGLTALLVVGALVWGAHRMTRPLRRFAEAADRLGLDAGPPPLPERGPRELRNATRAFNRMTARIRRLVDDRTLMLAAVSHDLKTMLTRLRLRAEFIEDVEQKEKAAADLDEMQAMLEATLSFARDDVADEHPVAVDLAAMLQSLAADFADAGRAASYDGPDRLTLHGRPVALRRVFQNLIDNALRYGEEAGVLLRQADGWAEVQIEDRGPGIPPELRERVFDPFFRVEASRSRDTGGSGLGLAVVRAIVQRHDGEIALEDRPGGGLRVRVSLPLGGLEG